MVLLVQIRGWWVARGALGLAEEQLFTSLFGFRSLVRIEPAGDGIKLWRRREIEHILHLRHMADLHPVQNHRSLLEGVDLVTVEVGRALLELSEILHRAQASLRSMHL